MSIKITPKIKAIKEYFKKLDGDLQKEFLAHVVDSAREDSRKRASIHTKTGKMERNIDSKLHPQKLQGEIFIANQGMLKTWRRKRVNYAVFVHFPTKPHLITLKNSKWRASRWVEDDKFRFAKKVKHPGYKGDPFLYRGLADTFKKLDSIFNKVINEEF